MKLTLKAISAQDIRQFDQCRLKCKHCKAENNCNLQRKLSFSRVSKN